MRGIYPCPNVAFPMNRMRWTIVYLTFCVTAWAHLMPSEQASARETDASNPMSEVVVPDSRNQIVKLTDKGIEPPVLEMKREDSIVFFLNQSRESLTTIEIDFEDKHTHCSSGNMSIIGGGKISSLRPFGPNDFSTTCFHDPGSYVFTVYGLKAKPAGITGTIVVK